MLTKWENLQLIKEAKIKYELFEVNTINTWCKAGGLNLDGMPVHLRAPFTIYSWFRIANPSTCIFFWQWETREYRANPHEHEKNMQKSTQTTTQAQDRTLKLWTFNTTHCTNIYVIHVAPKCVYIFSALTVSSHMCKLPMPWALWHPHTMNDAGFWTRHW